MSRRPLLVTIVGFFFLLTSWALVTPVGSSPDDDYHLAMLYVAADKAPYSPEGKRVFPCYALDPTTNGDCLIFGDPNNPKPGEGLLPADFQQSSEPVTSGSVKNFYPPGFYSIQSIFVSDTLATTTIKVRMANIVLATFLLAGSLVLTRKEWRVAVGVSWAVTSVPLGLFIFSSMNPQAWAIAGIAAMWGPLLSYLTYDQRRVRVGGRTPEGKNAYPLNRRNIARIVFVQIAVLLAIFSRSEAAVIVGLTITACGLYFLSQGRWKVSKHQWWRLLFPVVLLGQALIVFAVFSLEKADAITSVNAVAPLGFWDAVEMAWSKPLEALSDPRLGWLDTEMPILVKFLIAGVFGAALISGIRILYPEKRNALLFMVFSSVVFIVYLYTQSNPNRFQPRYFLPILFVIVGIALLQKTHTSADQVRSRHTPDMALFTTVQWSIIAVALVVANSLSLRQTLLRFIEGDKPEAQGFSALFDAPVPQWWWISWLSPVQLWAFGSIAGAVAIIAGSMWIASHRTVVPRHEKKSMSTVSFRP